MRIHALGSTSTGATCSAAETYIFENICQLSEELLYPENIHQLQQFDKPTWHSSNFGKTRKIGL
jgi:hypothetical protein